MHHLSYCDVNSKSNGFWFNLEREAFEPIAIPDPYDRIEKMGKLWYGSTLLMIISNQLNHSIFFCGSTNCNGIQLTSQTTCSSWTHTPKPLESMQFSNGEEVLDISEDSNLILTNRRVLSFDGRSELDLEELGQQVVQMSSQIQSLVLLRDGRVFGRGSNSAAQLGSWKPGYFVSWAYIPVFYDAGHLTEEELLGDSLENGNVTQKIERLDPQEKIVKIVTGRLKSFFLTTRGRVIGCGENISHCLGFSENLGSYHKVIQHMIITHTQSSFNSFSLRLADAFANDFVEDIVCCEGQNHHFCCVLTREKKLKASGYYLSDSTNIFMFGDDVTPSFCNDQVAQIYSVGPLVLVITKNKDALYFPQHKNTVNPYLDSLLTQVKSLVKFDERMYGKLRFSSGSGFWFDRLSDDLSSFWKQLKNMHSANPKLCDVCIQFQ